MQKLGISKTLNSKKNAKDYLRNEYGLGINKKRLLLTIIIDESCDKDIVAFLQNFLEGSKAVSVSVIILCPNNLKKSLEGFKSPRGVFVMQNNSPTVMEKVLEASDVSFVFPLSSTKKDHLTLMWHLGVVPIAPEKTAQDYDPNKETGNSFVSRNNDVWSIFAALVRAAETFRFPYDWKHIIRQALKGIPLES